MASRWRLALWGVTCLTLVLGAWLVFTRLPGVATEWAFTALERNLGVTGRVEAVEFNPLTLVIRVRGLSLWAVGHEQDPFLVAEGATLDLPWSVVLGSAAIESLDVEAPAVSVRRRPDGGSNLPQAAQDAEPSPSPEPSEPWQLGAVELRRATLSVVDESRVLQVTIDPMRLRLDSDEGSARGRLTLERPTVVAWGGRQTAIEPSTVELAFDGATLTVGGLDLVAPEGRLRAAGELVVAGGPPRVALDYRLDADLDALSVWVPDATWGGEAVSLAGRLDGSLAAPGGTTVVDATRVQWGGLEARGVRLEAALDRREVTISELAVEVAGGSVTGTGAATLLDRAPPDTVQTRGELNLDWTNIDIGQIVAGLGLALPSSVASSVTGTLNASWPGHDPRQWVAAVETELEPRAGVPTGVGGRWRAETAAGQWRVDLEELTTSTVNVTGQLSGAIPTSLSTSSLDATPLQGGVAVEVFDVQQLAADLESTGVVGPSRAALSGSASVALDVAGTLASPVLVGDLRARGRALDSNAPLDLEAGLFIDAAQWRLDPLDLQWAGSRSTGVASVDPVTGLVEGGLHVQVPDLGMFAALLPSGWAPEGAVEVDGRLSGQWPSPRFDATLDARDLALGGQHARSVQARVGITPTGVALEGVTMAQTAGGTLEADGSFSTDGRYTVSATGRGIEITPWLPESENPLPVSTRVDLDVSGEGSVDAPQASGRVVLHNPTFGEYTVGRVEHDLVVDPSGWQLHALVPSLSASADLALRPGDGWRYEMDGTLARVDLVTLGELVGWDAEHASGTLGLSLRAFGTATDPGGSAVTVDLEHLDAQIVGTPVSLASPVELRYGPGELVVGELDLSVGETRLTGSGTLGTATDTGLRLTAHGDLRDLEPLLARPEGSALDAGPTVAGGFQLDVLATGSVEQPMLTASLVLDDAEVTSAGMPPVSGVSVRMDYDAEGLRLEELRGRVAGAPVTASGLIPLSLLEPWLPDGFAVSGLPESGRPPGLAVLSARVENLAPAALSAGADGEAFEGLDGTVALAVEMEADRLELSALRGTLQLDQLELELGGLPVTQQRPTRFVVEEERLTVDGFAWQIGDAASTVTLGGSIALTPVPTADLTLTGTADLRVINAFTDGVALTGDATLIANLGGTLDDPRVDGVVELEEAELRVAEPQLVVSGLSGALVFQESEMRTVELAGTANGGPVALDGVVRFPGGTLAGEVSLEGESIAMVLPPGVRTELDTQLVLQIEPDDAVLSGTVALVRGDYREPINAAGGVLAALESRPPPVLVGAEPSWLEGIRLDVRVLTQEDVAVSNNYGIGTLGADTRVGGTVARPAVTGRAIVGDGGQVFLGGNTFEIESARVDFVDPDGIVPEIDATARTTVGNEEITITFEGTADTLTTTMRTVSGLPESDIVSLLLTGRTLDDVGAAPGVVARDQALGLVSGEVLGVAGRSVGLDTVRLDRGLDTSLVAGETNPGTRVTVGKNLSRQVELVASQSLRASGLLTWIVNYLPRPSVELRLVIDDDTDRSYEFRHAVSFGGTRATAARAEERVVPRVASITLSGAMALPEAELRNRLRLDTGDEFDFLRWQDSRDRLERRLWAGGYQEARIRMRRDLGEDGTTIALGLEIESGPRCWVEARGYAFPSGVVEEMEEAWRGSVFDTFLLEELEDIARRSLAREGYTRPVVTLEAVVSPDGVEKRITLDVAPGVQASERVIRFAGNSGLSDASLDALLTPDVEADAWAGGTLLVDALLATYRSGGWLAAEARVETPRVEDGTAVIDVAVAEGPRFQVSEVAVDGAERWEAERVLAAAGIEPGVVYTADLAEVARAAVLVAYRQDGFTAVRVRVEAAVARTERQAALRIVVEEGRRQLLREVDIVGGEGTHAGLIDRALQLVPGAPVDQAVWNQARKRLYATGVFRSVDIAAVPIAGEPAALDEPVTARVTLEPWPLYKLRYGLQVIDERAPAGEARNRGQFGAVADLTRRNLFGRAVSIGTSVRSDAVQKAVRGFMSVPTFFGREVTSNVFVSRLRETLGANGDALSDSHSLTLEQQIRPAEAVTFSYSYNIKRDHTFDKDLDPTSPFAFDVTVDIARLNTSLVLEHRDDLFDATRGWFHASTLEWGVARLGSDLRFLKYVGQHYHFRPVGRGVVLASAARVGLGAGFGQELIPSERFFAGGGNTVRGYSQDSLGPVSFFGPGGGSASLVFNQEVRLPIWSLFRGVGFVDAGNVFSSVRDLSLTALRVAVGLGLRAETPVGLFRLDYGVPLSRDDNDPRGRWSASLGQAF